MAAESRPYDQPMPVKSAGEFPNQSDRGKCELRLDRHDKLFCEKQECKGECVLYSLPRDDPKADPRQEDQPCAPKNDRYYYCKCA